jgi:hypothetical protein
MHPRLKKKKKSHGCCGMAPWLLGGGTAVAMAIVTSALMRDRQYYVFGTARPDLTKDSLVRTMQGQPAILSSLTCVGRRARWRTRQARERG